MSLRDRIHEVIFEAETPAGKRFDIGLLILILISIVVVALETVEDLHEQYGHLFYLIEWVVTGLFTLEYALRIYCLRKPWPYIRSFYGLVDLISILPTYLSLFLPGSQYLLTVRALRLMRIFRVLKLSPYLIESSILATALRQSRRKITVFLGAVLTVVLIVGTTMYLVEGGAGSGFTSIPRSIYWAIVTITTVGYGDIAPVTPLGQFLSAMLMIMGYGVIAVPTGIVSVELAAANQEAKAAQGKWSTRACPGCGNEGHDADADYCKYCGEAL